MAQEEAWMTYKRDPLTELPAAEWSAFMRAARQINAFLPEFLLRNWARLTEAEVADSYPHMLEEYENDLDGRRVIEDILDTLAESEIPKLRAVLAELDDQFRRSTLQLEHPIWGYGEAHKDPVKYFFYFRLPRQLGPEIQNGLRTLGHKADLDYVLSQAES